MTQRNSFNTGYAAEQPNFESEIFHKFRSVLHDANGQQFSDFKKTLQPSYARVWANIACAHTALALCIFGLVQIQTEFEHYWQQVPAGLILALVIGYLFAFLSNWLHEATHYNIHPERKWNDLLANLALGLILIQDVRKYRPIHFAHHKHLGTVSDTEISYFSALNFRFFFESLTGIKALRVLFLRGKLNRNTAAKGDRSTSAPSWVPMAGMAVHLGIICVALLTHFYLLGTGWFLGVFIFFPFFCALRQVLEHRSPAAHADLDYTVVPHGEFTHVFGGGLFAGTFGGAGFNRHLIHHWEPQISCTNFGEVEQFLLESQLKEFYMRRQTTYTSAFVALLKQ